MLALLMFVTTVQAETEPSQDTSPAPASGYSQKNRAGTRYLYAPTAIPLEKGTGYFSQKELVMSSVAYGLTDNISVLGGTPLPITIWALSTGEFDALMAIGAVKVGYQVAPQAYIGGGVEAFTVAGEVFGIGFVNGTVGNLDSNLTLGLGHGFWVGAGSGFTPVVLAGQHRVGERVALISENWTAILDGEFYALTTGGARIIADRLAVDMALMGLVLDGEFLVLPIPWVDFTWHFGG